MNRYFIKKDVHVKYESGRCVLYIGELTDFCLSINREMMRLLSVVVTQSDEENISANANHYFNIDPKYTSKLLQTLKPYLSHNDCNQNMQFANELRATVLSAQNKTSNTVKKFDLKRFEHPLTLSIALTKSCGRKCVYCMANAPYDRNNVLYPTMSLELFTKIINEARILNISNVIISGGDALTVKNIEDYIEIATQNKIECFISTKYLVTKDKAKKLRYSGLNSIQVSLDSSDKTLADGLMGQIGAFDEVVQSIYNLKEAGFLITIRCVIMKQNIRNIPKFIIFCEQMGADRITFNLYENSCGRQDSKFFAPAEDIFWLSKSIESIKQECENIIIDYSPSLFDFFISQRGLDQVGRHYYRGVCGAYKSSMIIREDGKVVYCEYLSELEETVIGDLNTSSIVEVWNSERYTNFSRPSKDLFTGTHCEMCEEFDACLNRRCYFRTKQAYGKLYDVDPMCKYGDVFFVRH